jgi:metal-sulfur cluster biosynthetic enzyme
MPYEVAIDFPAECDGAALLQQLARVLDPELDEAILDLGFVRSVQLRAGHASVALQLPTSWCAVNFAFMMAQDVRGALLAVEGVREVTVRLGDHCAAEEIEAAVNRSAPFAAAFADAGCESLEALRRNFLRKGFLARQQRLLHALHAAGWSFTAIAALRLEDVAIAEENAVCQRPGGALAEIGPAEILGRYVERRAELGLDCRPAVPLIVDPDGETLTPQQLDDYYRMARTTRVSLEANGAFCRAVLASRELEAAEPFGRATGGGIHVPP